jgi:hypothetical protein
MMWEAGVGAQTAQFQWYCSWARAALRGGRDLQPALARLRRFPTLSVWDAMDDAGHVLFRGIIDDASRGRFDSLVRYVQEDC